MDKSEVNAVRTLKSVGVVKRSPLHSTRTPSDHRGSGTPQGSDWDSGSSVVWYSKQGGSESSVRSRSLSLPGDRNPRSGQVWQTVSHRQAGRGSGSPQVDPDPLLGPKPPSLLAPASAVSLPRIFF